MPLIVNVPQDYLTIQLGINAVDPGGTVFVGPQTYPESILITKPLTLVSTNGPAVTIIDGLSATENYYVVDIEASNVTVDGFTITNSLYDGTADASGVVIDASGKNSNIQVLNNIIHDIGLMSRSPVSFGTHGINCGPVDTITIQNNKVYNIGNNDPSAWARGIFVWGNGPDPQDICTNITIRNNTVHDIINPGNLNDGIRLGGDTANVLIDSNTIYGILKQGISTSAGMLGNIAITNNTVAGASVSGLLLESPFLQTVQGNSITDNTSGIQINAAAGTVTVTYNDIVRNTTFGLNNLSANLVNAENNWWGSKSGPNQPGSDQVNGNVDFTPWLLSPLYGRRGAGEFVAYYC